MAKSSKARIAANNRYSAKAYDRLYPFVPKGRKAEIQAAAEEAGETLNEFIVKAIDERMYRIEAAKPFVPPTGEFCTDDCKRRGVKISKSSETSYTGMIKNGVPWCSAFTTELTWQDREKGICYKCDKCLSMTTEKK